MLKFGAPAAPNTQHAKATRFDRSHEALHAYKLAQPEMQSPAAPLRDPQPPPSLPLTSAAVVCRSRAVEALPHVVERISGFIDCATPERWSLARACERGDFRLLRRAAATRRGWSSPDVDQHYKEFVASKALVTAVRSDDRAIVSWLCFEHCPSMIPMNGIDEAARLGNLTLLEWFFANHEKALWGRRLADAAVQHGHLEVLQWVLPHIETAELVLRGGELVSRAAMHGQLKIVKWLHEYNSQRVGEDASILLNAHALLYAIYEGHLEMAQFLFSHGYPLELRRNMRLCTACRSGNFDMIKWVHTLPQAQGSVGWMDEGAATGDLDMVQWVHEHLADDECTERAMDQAATRGHFHVVRWLHENRSEGCTALAMENAVQRRLFDALLFLHTNRAEGCTENTALWAISSNSLEIFQWLYANYPERVDLNDILARSRSPYDEYKCSIVQKLRSRSP